MKWNFRGIFMAEWIVDRVHSTIGFEVKHMMISNVNGQFDSYTAKIEAEDMEDLATATVEFKLDVASVNTYSPDRDNHLKSAEFFNADAFPKITFTSTNIEKKGTDYLLHGQLTIKETTSPITFNVKYGGKGVNLWGTEVYGFAAETFIIREDFKLIWGAAIEASGMLVDKKVKIKVDLQVNPA